MSDSCRCGWVFPCDILPMSIHEPLHKSYRSTVLNITVRPRKKNVCQNKCHWICLYFGAMEINTLTRNLVSANSFFSFFFIGRKFYWSLREVTKIKKTTKEKRHHNELQASQLCVLIAGRGIVFYFCRWKKNTVQIFDII